MSIWSQSPASRLPDINLVDPWSGVLPWRPSPTPPARAALTDWLGPDRGTISSHSFPNSLRDPGASAGDHSGDRSAGLLPSFDPAWWLSPELRSITGTNDPSAQTAQPARRSALDDPTLPSPLTGGGTAPVAQSYPAPPFDTTAYDWRTGRWATPPAPGRPSPGDPGQLPFLQRALSSPEETGRLKGLDQTSIAPSVWPTAVSTSSSALPAQAPGAWPSPGGILSGWTPVSTAGGRGILSGLFPDGASPSPGDAMDDHSSWEQMLQGLWLRRMQENVTPDDSNR
jgi:hypothetical protein